jgi:predicted nucleotidyltransferase
MPRQDQSFRQLLPSFIISPGTQVVLKTARPLANGESFKPAGSVAIVVESPATNDTPYLVRFADGQTVLAHQTELALRRHEVENELAPRDEDLRDYVIYRCQVGSKAFGLATDESDDDLRGIFLPPARFHWSLRPLPEQIESTVAERDEVYWELEKFLRLALKANPTVLEILWTPLVLHATDLSGELRSLRGSFLSQHVYKTYSGYVLSQFRRMTNAVKRQGTYKAKHAMHLVRLLLSGTAALDTGEIQIDMSQHRDELLAIRRRERSFDDVQRRALELDAAFQQAFLRTSLPEQPDYSRIDDFLIRARRSMVDA